MGIFSKIKLKRESIKSFEDNELDDMGPGDIPEGARNE